jgi:hypothetical protein
MLAGVCLGLIEVFTTTYFGSVYTQLLTFAAVILILVVLPNGLLGRAGVKKVRGSPGGASARRFSPPRSPMGPWPTATAFSSSPRRR